MIRSFGTSHFAVNKTATAICGAALESPYSRITRLPPMVSCPVCKETQEYKDTLYELEIGFDGNLQKFAQKLFDWMK